MQDNREQFEFAKLEMKKEKYTKETIEQLGAELGILMRNDVMYYVAMFINMVEEKERIKIVKSILEKMNNEKKEQTFPGMRTDFPVGGFLRFITRYCDRR